MKEIKKTIVILGHPRLEISNLNKKIKTQLEAIEGIEYYHIDKLKNWNVKDEQKMIETYDRIILQFPIYWGAMPGAMKEYFEEVFNNQWAYLNSHIWKDKELIVIATFGNQARFLDKLGLGVIYTLGLSTIAPLMKAKPKKVFRYYANKNIDKFIDKIKKIL